MRVARAFAFVDLCGFTAFTERHGDEVAVKVLGELRAVLRDIAARRGVRVAKWLGDGAMLSSASTNSLVAMAVEIRHRLRITIPGLSLRVGIDAGPVIMFEGDDYIGRAVNVASRICDEAAPDQILATRNAAEDSPRWAMLGDVHAVDLKGFARLIDVVSIEVTESPRAATVTDVVCGLTIASEFAIDSSEHATSAGGFCSIDCAAAFPHRELESRRPIAHGAESMPAGKRCPSRSGRGHHRSPTACRRARWGVTTGALGFRAAASSKPVAFCVR